MALQNTDLFYVQRGTDGHKIEYEFLREYIADTRAKIESGEYKLENLNKLWEKLFTKD